MTEELHGFEEDGMGSEANPLRQENKVLRGRLTELTEQLAESEERRVTLLQKMYDPRCLSNEQTLRDILDFLGLVMLILGPSSVCALFERSGRPDADDDHLVDA